jgi:hypothetical protein
VAQGVGPQFKSQYQKKKKGSAYRGLPTNVLVAKGINAICSQAVESGTLAF